MVLSAELAKLLKQTNDRLRRGKIGVTLAVQGQDDWLYLRGTFPPKPNSKLLSPHQQRIALKARANCPEVIKQAELIARKIGLAKNMGEFSWSEFDDSATVEQLATAGDWVAAFTAWWWENKDPNDGAKQSTWQCKYRHTLNKIPADYPLTEQLLVEWVTGNSSPGTAMRDTYARTGVQLAKFAKLPSWERLQRLTTTFNIKAINPRDLPTDNEILRIRGTIADPEWQHVYGILAAYGLRPHEIFFLDYSDYPTLQTAETTKTGRRLIKPLYPEWADEWGLGDAKMPHRLTYRKGQANRLLGGKVTEWFRDRLTFSPYNLRHAYAQRGIKLGVPHDALAYMMGHSIKMHMSVYRAWIDEKLYIDVADRALQKSDRPLPPKC